MTLLVEYVLKQSRHLTGEETKPKTRKQDKELNRGMTLLTGLSLAVRSNPHDQTPRGLVEVVTCIYGPAAVTYAFADPLVTACRHLVVRVSLIINLDGRALNWYKQGHLKTRTSETVLFGKDKDRHE